jgi:hypothetical protein
MKTKRNQEGYLLIDNRATEEAIPGFGSRIFETGAVTCSHCQAGVIINPQRTRARGYCPKCDHYICDSCEIKRFASGGECKPFKKLLDEAQERLAKGLFIGDILNG